MDIACDVLVVGGGIHGVGVAQAAAARGFRVSLVEQTALAAGTSSKSSKLIHGGLRYLETGSLRLVRANLRERELLLKLAPGLIHRRDFVLPIYAGSRRKPWQVSAGLVLYSALAGFRRETWFRRLPKSEWDRLDGLATDQLTAVYQYPDAQTDDAALTRAVMRSAQDLGAQLHCPARLISTKWESDTWTSECIEVGSGQSLRITSRALVNAAGPWAQRLCSLILPNSPPPEVDLVQGTHIELPGPLTQGCYYAETLPDHRYVFVLPWKGHTLVGTTESLFNGDPATVAPLPEEVVYLTAAYHRLFPQGSTELLDAWAGLRVLPRSPATSPFARSRETVLHADRATECNHITILGGKLTGYRLTAEKVMDRLAANIPTARIKAKTSELALSDT